MKKLKILVSIMLALVMTLSLVAMVACNDPDEGKGDRKIELLLWAPSGAQTFYKKWADKWAETYKDSQGRQYTVKMGIMGEGDAGTSVMNAPEDSADVFCFADDQVSKLAKAGDLAEIGAPTSAAAKPIVERNSAGSVSAATYDGKLYAYPMQADNGYFLYYDSSILTAEDVKSWEGIFAKLETYNQGKEPAKRVKAQLSYGEAFYQASFFFTFGGTVTESTTNFDTDAVGLKALKAAYKLSKYADFAAMDVDKMAAGFSAGTIAAGVSGSWSYTAATKDNDKIKLTVLPTITVDGETKPMKSFLGSKLMGVNGQGRYLEASHALANYLTDEDVQTDKAKELSAGPSNINASQTDVAKALPTLAALSAQAANSVPQVNLPAGFWDALPTCVNAVNATSEKIGDYFNTDGTAIEAKLKELLAALKTGFKLA